MRLVVFFYLLIVPYSSNAKEWKNLKHYQESTQNKELLPQDWLASDRKHNTTVWQNANTYNLTNNKPEEYTTIKQRRDFYEWISTTLKEKGHEVAWTKMAYFISNKMRLMEAFPYSLLTNKNMKRYAQDGSDVVFNNAFFPLKTLYLSETILRDKDALSWDKFMLHKEQYEWIQEVYDTIDDKGLEQIERIARGKSLYGIFVPKAIRFEGEISKPEDRYHYALNKLRVYCISELK